MLSGFKEYETTLTDAVRAERDFALAIIRDMSGQGAERIGLYTPRAVIAMEEKRLAAWYEHFRIADGEQTARKLVRDLKEQIQEIAPQINPEIAREKTR